MHRAYQPIKPTNNKVLQKKWDTAIYNTHRKRVITAVPRIDNKPPRTFVHLHLKLKKLQIEEERVCTVERDNRILLEKMAYIMRTRGRVDNRNDYTQKSLNKTKRQMELITVTHENQAFLKRLNSREANYNRNLWEEDWRNHLNHINNISRYPIDWYKQTREGSRSKVKKGRRKSLQLQSKENDDQDNQEKEDEKEVEKEEEQEETKEEEKEEEENEEQEEGS